MEVASLITGSISLAITLCDGLITYYQAWASQDNDINETVSRLTTLQETLDALKVTAGDLAADNVAGAELLSRMCAQVDLSAEKLKVIYEKCKGRTPPTTSGEKLQHVWRKTMYPFKRQTLKEIESAVAEMRGNLMTASDGVQLNLSKKISSVQQQSQASLTQLSAIATTTNNHVSLLPHIGTQLQDVADRSKQLHQQTTRIEDAGLQNRASLLRIEAVTTTTSNHASMIPHLSNQMQSVRDSSSIIQGHVLDVEQNLMGLSNDSKAMLNMMRQESEKRGNGQRVIQQIYQILSAQQGSIQSQSRHSDAHVVGMQLIQNPALHRDMCSQLDLSMAHNNDAQMKVRHSNVMATSPWCTCRHTRRRNRRQVQVSGISFFRQTDTERSHYPDCPDFIRNKEACTYGVQIDGLKYFLQKTVEVAFTWNSGSGGRCMSQSLNIRRMYRPQSPVFQLLDLIRRNRHRANAVRWERVLTEIQKLYRDDKASPYDVNEDGDYILHRLMFTCSLLIIFTFDPRKKSNIESLIRLTRWLIQVSEPVSQEGGRWGLTPLGVLTTLFSRFQFASNSQSTSRVYQQLEKIFIEQGGASLTFEPSQYPLGTGIIVERWLSFKAFRSDIQEFDCGTLGQALHNRSESQLIHELQQRPQQLFGIRTVWRWNALHLAADWLRGVEIILQYGGASLADKVDKTNISPADVAMASGNARAIELLLPLEKERFWDQLGNRIHGWDHLNRATALVNFTILITELKSRGDELRVLAQERLPREKWKSLPVHGQGVLEADVPLVHSALVDTGVHVPARLAAGTGRRFVYASIIDGSSFLRVKEWDTLVQKLDILWAAGFRNINAVYKDDRSPLAIACERGNTAAIDWLIHKGAVYVYPTPKACATCLLPSDGSLLHTIAAVCAEKIFWYVDRNFQSSDPCYVRLEQSVRLNDCFDSCRCGCSVIGCSPLSVYLKSLPDYPNYWGDTYGQRRRRMWKNPAFKALAAMDQAALPFIRLATFSVLGIEHTCCKWYEYCPSHYRASASWQSCLLQRCDESDIDEIHQDWQQQIAKLESLMQEFQQQYTDLTLSLSEFLRGYWKDRMVQVLKCPSEPLDASKPDILNADGLGVHVDLIYQGCEPEIVWSSSESDPEESMWDASYFMEFDPEFDSDLDSDSDSDSDEEDEPTEYPEINEWIPYA